MVVRDWGQSSYHFGDIGWRVGFGLSALLGPITAGGFTNSILS